MTTATLTGTDVRLRNFVVRELDWDPEVDASNADLDARNLRVEAAGDVVTLTATVGSCRQREAAEHGAASAPGIRLVQNRILVVPPPGEELDEKEIC